MREALVEGHEWVGSCEVEGDVKQEQREGKDDSARREMVFSSSSVGVAVVYLYWAAAMGGVVSEGDVHVHLDRVWEVAKESIAGANGDWEEVEKARRRHLFLHPPSPPLASRPAASLGLWI